MNKKHLHHIWTKFRAVKPWYFLILFVVSSAFCVNALRQNNLTMVRLRSDVYTTDKNNGDVNTALKNLQAFVVSNMNADLSGGPNAAYPPIQLQYTYQRLETAENQQVAATNAQVYTDAQTYCQQQNPVSFSGRTRVPCVEQYVQQHGATATSIPAALYEFDFISPRWSPDLAGWLLILSIVLFVLFAISGIIRRWLKRAV